MLLDLDNTLDRDEIHKSVWSPAYLLVIQAYFLEPGTGVRIFETALELEDTFEAFLRILKLKLILQQYYFSLDEFYKMYAQKFILQLWRDNQIHRKIIKILKFFLTTVKKWTFSYWKSNILQQQLYSKKQLT